jgi:hypothetical protein
LTDSGRHANKIRDRLSPFELRLAILFLASPAWTLDGDQLVPGGDGEDLAPHEREDEFCVVSRPVSLGS